MLKADLHVHSKYSNHPSEWFLQRMGASESYTEPEYIYKTAKAKGMDFVTITDHNCISGAIELNNAHPEDTFVSVESTVYFPEDDGKVHILIYDITEEQFGEIQKLRTDIYKLRDFIKENTLAHSVAHATYSVNGTLKVEHLEKLVLLFDVFETVNGGRSKASNDEWYSFLEDLKEEDIRLLQRKYGIEPYGDTPWVKGYTGGSDDHAGLYIAKTQTKTDARDMEEFIENLKKKKTIGKGRCNDFKGLAFTLYKIAYDFASRSSDDYSKNMISQITSFVFEEKSLKFKDKFKINQLKNSKKSQKIKQLIGELIEELDKKNKIDTEEKLDLVYEKVSDISDEFIKNIIKSLIKHLNKGDIYKAIKDLSAALPGMFLSVPFLSTFKHMFDTRGMVENLRERLNKKIENRSKKILWFSDTVNDLNGVSVTLKKIGWLSHAKDKDLQIVTSLTKDEITSELPPNVINLENVKAFPLPYYEKYIVKIPSILKSLDFFYNFNPDEIYISTPGPIGLLGVMVSKLLNVKCTGVYHTDFSMQIKQMTKNHSLINMMESYTKWFYSMMNHTKVPTQEYISILEGRGMNASKMSVFKRGIEMDVFRPRDKNEEYFEDLFGIPNGINLVYTGRISKDKNIDFLAEVFKKLRKKHKNLNLILVGDGPDYELFRKEYTDKERIYFTGKVNYKEIPDVYTNSDIFVFPSVTDTFGMSVMEAQACGLPAIVSDIGGPKEIVRDKKTGYVTKALDESDWYEKMDKVIGMMQENQEEYMAMRNAATQMVAERFSWDNVLKDIFVS